MGGRFSVERDLNIFAADHTVISLKKFGCMEWTRFECLEIRPETLMAGRGHSLTSASRIDKPLISAKNMNTHDGVFLLMKLQ